MHNKKPKKVAAKRRSTAITKTQKQAISTRRRRRKKGTRGLGQLWSPTMARGAAMSTASGFMGGGATAIIENLLDKLPKPPHEGFRIAGYLAGGFALAALFRLPNMGAGVAAMAGYKLLKVTGLAQADEDADNAQYAREIEDMPAMLDVSGQPMAENNNMYLQEDNNMYLQDNEDLFLQEDGSYQVAYAPEFGHPTTLDDLY